MLTSPPSLGVLDEPAQDPRHPVEVLAAGVHGDLGPGGEGEPLDRHVHRGGEIDRRQHTTALGLGDRAHRPRRVAEQGDPRHPLRVALGRRADDADDDAGAVLARRPLDGPEQAVLIEVVLDERAPLAAQQRHELVRVDEAAAAGLDELACVVVERLHRRRRRRRHPDGQTPTGLVAEAHHGLHRLVGAEPGEAPADDDLLEPEAFGERHEPPGHLRQLVERDVDRRPDVEHDPVPLQPPQVRAGRRAPDGWRRARRRGGSRPRGWRRLGRSRRAPA